MADRNLPHQGPAGRKSVLFCPTCGHDDPIDGAWSVADDGDRADIECPRCGTLVVSQPRFDTGSRFHPFAGVDPLLQLVNAVVSHDVL